MPKRCCQPDYDATFGADDARRELAAYRRDGARGTTLRLVNALRAQGVDGATVLDIGGGIGVVGVELLSAGASSLTDVDAAGAYLAAARSELARRGFEERARFFHADFVATAQQFHPADVVTLDRVLCCYGDWRAMVDRSAAHARRLYGLVYPVDRWWTRSAIAVQNAFLAALRRPFRFSVHPDAAVDARIRGHGFRPIFHDRGLVWQTVVYQRTG